MSLTHSALALATVAIGGAMLTRGILRFRRHMDLRGKVAIVTGGSRGIGLAIARELVERGAKVTICARDELEMRDALEDLEARGGDVLAVTCDVTQADEISNVVDRTRERFGPVDVLVNNAGIIVVGPASAMTIADYRDTMDVNFEAPLLFMLDVIPEMRQRRQGRIVNIASFGGKVPAPHLATYCASKFALVGLSETLRTELAEENVFVTTVCPGLVRSGSSGHAKFKGQHRAEHAWFEAAANSPAMTIAPDRLARQVVDALVVGQAELITPISAAIEAKLHGLLPGVAAEVITFFNRFLPAPTPPTPMRPGVDLGHVPSELLQKRQERAERDFNESDDE
ncbi:MAG: SDR family NAD(P)-dependent oxidoreductase [Tepidisphaeraceae bacterium]